MEKGDNLLSVLVFSLTNQIIKIKERRMGTRGCLAMSEVFSHEWRKLIVWGEYR